VFVVLTVILSHALCGMYRLEAVMISIFGSGKDGDGLTNRGADEIARNLRRNCSGFELEM
jgi:hypothetical protein